MGIHIFEFTCSELTHLDIGFNKLLSFSSTLAQLGSLNNEIVSN